MDDETREARRDAGGLCENVTRAGESPAFDTKFFLRVGDVIDSIEVLQTSCEGLNPSRSTKNYFRFSIFDCRSVIVFDSALVARSGRGG
jgi:hypothetical protein